MKTIFGGLGVTVASLLAITAAGAADLSQPAPVSLKDAYVPGPVWTGFYIGAHGGWARDPATVTDQGGFEGAGAGTKTVWNPSGAFGGGTIGYNIQRGAVVFGPEADLGYMNDAGTHALVGTNAGTTTVGLDGGIYGDVTGRLGIALDRALIYGKGGFAFYDGGNTFNTSIGGVASSKTGAYTGWTIGGGLEYKFTPVWSVKGEYQYFDFGSQDFTVTGGAPSPDKFSEEVTVHTVKLGVNYAIVPGYEPLK
jgi:outer membrane immunogenic protein